MFSGIFNGCSRTTVNHPKKLFKLPIYYVKNHLLSPDVATDLELLERNIGSPTMYDYLLQPSHIFAKNTTKEWSKVFTRDIEYLENTQKVIEEFVGDSESDSNSNGQDGNTINRMWREIQDDKDFIDRFGYMEWDALHEFNESASFLQTLSIVQITSPLLTILMPFFILFFPLLVLCLQGGEITFESYICSLKNVSKNHFIGKMLRISSLDAKNIFYMLFSFAFYVFSTYQNMVSSDKFYKNIKRMNHHLETLKQFFEDLHPRMQSFIQRHREKPKYTEFCDESQQHCDTIKKLNATFSFVKPFSHSLYYSLTHLGEMLKVYYTLYTDSSIKESIEYAFGFEGYLDNIKSLSSQLKKGNISFSRFSEDTPTTIEQQYYPCLVNETHVKNDVSLAKNIIITGPNASGKTTCIKTTTINIIFSQQFGCGFYASANINPYTRIHSYLNIPDTSERDSLFQAESRRCKDILDEIKKSSDTDRHLCIFDELYSGTNYKDATKSATSFLKYLSKHENVDYLLTTHYTRVCKNLKKEKRISLFKMDVKMLGDDGQFQYLYKLKKGISKVEGGVNILREMDYPPEIIHGMKECGVK
jgi:hypothetical protein